jgi:hypothetical protein
MIMSGPSLTGLRGTQITGSISYTLVMVAPTMVGVLVQLEQLGEEEVGGIYTPFQM